MTPDLELLATFARTNSEDAFAELVQRHVNLVYSAALRQVNGDEHLAKDVAQSVFTDLARKAGSLTRRETLTGWLYTSAHFAATKIIRSETRRRDREETFMREPTNESAPAAEWENLRPLLDAAMHELKAADREAILLRYFENQPFAAVAAKLRLNENAARMRVERALEKLRAVLAKHGIAATATLASVISANAMQLAPAGLAATLTTASTISAGTGTFTLMKILTATKLKLAASALVVAGATTAFVIQHEAQEKLRTENESLTQQFAQLQTDNQSLSNRLVAPDDSKKLPDDQFNELLKLRGEVGVLRNQVDGMAKLRDENQRLQAMQLDAKTQWQAGIKAGEKQDAAMRDELNSARSEMIAFIEFANHHQNQFPTNFTQLAHYSGNKVEQVETNFDVVYQGSMTDIANPSATIVLKGKHAWPTLEGNWANAYGFADGHAEIHVDPNGNFDDWERQHMIPPPNQ